MDTETLDQPELACQWCGGTIPAGANACADCGALRPRDDLVVPGLTREKADPALQPEAPAAEPEDDAERARQIFKEMDAYIPEPETSPAVTRRDPGDDLIIVIAVIVGGGVVGGLIGWLALPPLLHELFQEMIGVDSDGPAAFRRLGAFIGALLTMLFGALLATMLRR